jgi:hypothetical protein
VDLVECNGSIVLSSSMDELNIPCFFVNAPAIGGLKLLKRSHIAQYHIEDKFYYRNILKYNITPAHLSLLETKNQKACKMLQSCLEVQLDITNYFISYSATKLHRV